MKILIDTNVIIDIAIEREPFVKNSVKFLKIAKNNKINALQPQLLYWIFIT